MQETFYNLGRIEAIARLFEGTGYKPFEDCRFETSGKSYISEYSRVMLEGIDFDLTYFPLKHLGYKSVDICNGRAVRSNGTPEDTFRLSRDFIQT